MIKGRMISEFGAKLTTHYHFQSPPGSLNLSEHASWKIDRCDWIPRIAVRTYTFYPFPSWYCVFPCWENFTFWDWEQACCFLTVHRLKPHHIFRQIWKTDEPWESSPGKELLLASGKESLLNVAVRRERKRIRKKWRGRFVLRFWGSRWGASSSCKPTELKTIGFYQMFVFCFVWEIVNIANKKAWWNEWHGTWWMQKDTKK